MLVRVNVIGGWFRPTSLPTTFYRTLSFYLSSFLSSAIDILCITCCLHTGESRPQEEERVHAHDFCKASHASRTGSSVHRITAHSRQSDIETTICTLGRAYDRMLTCHLQLQAESCIHSQVNLLSSLCKPARRVVSPHPPLNARCIVPCLTLQPRTLMVERVSTGSQGRYKLKHSTVRVA